MRLKTNSQTIPLPLQAPRGWGYSLYNDMLECAVDVNLVDCRI